MKNKSNLVLYVLLSLNFFLTALLTAKFYQSLQSGKFHELQVDGLVPDSQPVPVCENTIDTCSNFKTENELWVEMVEKNTNAVGQLFTFSNTFNFSEPYKTPHQTASRGTAFFIDLEGHMITNAHCVDQAEVMFLQLPKFGKHRFDVSLVATCPDKDLALIKLSNQSVQILRQEFGAIPYLSIGDSDSVKRAQEIVALGYPLGQEWLKSTTGVVSGLHTNGAQSLIQISAPINPGSSGGPALDIAGKVIGVNSCGIFEAQNVGYIIPSKEVLIFLSQAKALLEESEAHHSLLIRSPMLGITFHGSPEALITYLGNPKPGGIYLANVIKNSFADKAGIEVGDMLYEINGYAIDRYGDMCVPWNKDKISLGTYVGQLGIGSKIEIIGYRKGKKLKFAGTWNVGDVLPIRVVYPKHETINYIVIAGMVIMPLTINHIQMYANMPKITEELIGYVKPQNQGEPALIVSHVLSNSVAQAARFINAGMIISEVNGIPAKTIEECSEALRKSLNTGFITFKMKNNEFFVAHLSKVLEDELRLSKTYYYQLSSITKELIDGVQSLKVSNS